jgi:hypothetical protein
VPQSGIPTARCDPVARFGPLALEYFRRMRKYDLMLPRTGPRQGGTVSGCAASLSGCECAYVRDESAPHQTGVRRRGVAR